MASKSSYNKPVCRLAHKALTDSMDSQVEIQIKGYGNDYAAP
jgi:hypothetical protein